MKHNKISWEKKACGLLLSLMLVIGMIPVNAFAAGGGTFVLVAEAGGTLAIAPEYVSYRDGETVGQALINSGHTFTGIEDGWITEIDGVVGNYHRSDQDGGFDLHGQASDVRYYRFSEDEEGTFTEGLQKLMDAMAAYQTKDADVKAAAKAEYDTAFAQFVGIDSDSAALLAEELNQAVLAYETIINGPQHQVTFADGSTALAGASITMENAYGKAWTDDGDGVMQLPAGTYTFTINKDGLWVEGQVAVSGNVTVGTALPKQNWLKQDAFRLSGSYEEGDGEDQSKFTDDEYALSDWAGRTLDVSVKDTFTGKIYSYAEYDESKVSDPTLTAVYISEKTGEETETELPFESFTSGIGSVLKKGAAGKTVVYRISNVGSDGYMYSQDYTVNFHRIPTLEGIKVTAVEDEGQAATDQAATEAFDSDKTAYTYKVLDTVKNVNVVADPLEEDYEIQINGQAANNGTNVTLNGNTEVQVKVISGDYSNTYNLTFQPGAGKRINFVTAGTDVTMEVVNKNGQVMPYSRMREDSNGNGYRYQYTLVPGETYSYVATKKEYYHIADEFTMENDANTNISVDVPTEDWMTELAFGEGKASGKKGSLALDTAFTQNNHKYTVEYIDTSHNAYIWVQTASDVKTTAQYIQKNSAALYHGVSTVKTLTSGASQGLQLNRFLMDENPIENTVTIRLTKEVNGITQYQDYVVDFHRQLTLQDISAKSDGVTTTLVQEDGTIGYEPAVREYSITVSMAAQHLNLDFSRYTEDHCYGEDEVGYRVLVDGIDVTAEDAAVVELDGTLDTQHVFVVVENDKSPTGTGEYVLHVLKSPPVETHFTMNPESALVAMYETMSGERVWPDENGMYLLCEGYSYNYAATAYGHVSKTGTLEVTRDDSKALIVKDGQQTYTVTETETGGGALTIEWSLEAAPTNTTIRTDMTAEWDSFRGDASNNAVTDAPVPTAAENGTLYWANKIGEGYSANAVGSPILVDGDLITYAGNKIYRVDTVTGEIKVTGTMDHKSAHATTPPSYAEGMVFVAQTDGTVQAFNADTLESLWIYKDPLGGQPVCPLTIHDGYLYTGFWNSEKGDGNFVCLSITDEDPSQMDETKAASWYHTAAGGYYWAGAYACDDFVMIGTDDGTSGCTGQSSAMLLFEPKTGKLMDSWDNLNGDIRSTVVYDETTNAYYFTSKGGTFYSMQVANTAEGWQFTNTWTVNLTNGTAGTPMSTCSPSVYNGRAYVGVSGEGQFAAYSGHNISVIDLTKKSVAYRVATQGYPQTSGLLTTAYEEESGCVYVYFFDNMTPGKLRVLRDNQVRPKRIM